MQKKAGIAAKFVLVILVASTAILATGCEEMAPVDTESIVLDNSLEGGYIEIPHEIEGEDFVFVTKYSTDYNTQRWRLTDNKTLNMQAWIESSGTAETLEVFIEHVHIDCSIQAVDASVDGLTQDAMDDKLHTGDQIGFWISEQYPYENIFIIEGTSETLMSGWGFVAGGYGSASMSEQRLTENNLVNRGRAYGSKIQAVYDLAIRYPGEDYFHTRAVVDELMIHVPQAEQIIEEAKSNME